MKYTKTGYENREVTYLLAAYQFENDRINKGDAERTKKLIRTELRARLDNLLNLLDNVDDFDRVLPLFEKQFMQGR